ncbi:50S ribosomal protein L21e [Candidatus Woesearchaeota archaeon CG11_big_fil_rev_8_21_14_0_20_57_5]|nr:MAG: 50S ribosomal protein L21e [Candidatus Woesearchaeota archaeon CG11_big_fil_rev_8_21_14_0_20_57_5]
MAKRIGSNIRKARYKLTKTVRQRGKISPTRFLQTFEKGDKVSLHAEPAYQKGNYHMNYHGKTAVVVAPKGRCYEVEIMDFTKAKRLIVHPVHLRRL